MHGYHIWESCSDRGDGLLRLDYDKHAKKIIINTSVGLEKESRDE